MLFNKYWLKISILLTLIFFIIVPLRINETNSVPLGLYYLIPKCKIKKGDYVVFKLDKEYEKYIAKDLRDKHSIKKVYGTYGDEIKIENNKIFINNIYIGDIRKDIEVKIPKFIKLQKDEYFLFSDNKDSLDSRYYGLINKRQITNKAILIFEIGGM